MTTASIVQRVWNYYHTLRDDGVSYGDYISEAYNLEKAIDESLGKSEALRQSILKKTFEGKLV